MKVLKKAIEKYIISYNTKRLHSTIGYKTPNEVYYQAVNNSISKGAKKLLKVSQEDGKSCLVVLKKRCIIDWIF